MDKITILQLFVFFSTKSENMLKQNRYLHFFFHKTYTCMLFTTLEYFKQESDFFIILLHFGTDFKGFLTFKAITKKES